MANKKKTKTSKRKGFAVKALSFHALRVIKILCHIIAILLATNARVFPGEEKMMSIFGTCAEIIAGLYGTTLAGYTFFVSRIDTITASDNTLSFVVSSMKNRFKYLIYAISTNVLMVLVISVALMYTPAPTAEDFEILYQIFCNEFILYLGSSVILILYYSVMVVDPNKIEKEAAELKRKLGGKSAARGNTAEFFVLYDQLVSQCSQLLPQSVADHFHNGKSDHFEWLLDYLEAEDLLPRQTKEELVHIHRYYQCVINCSPLDVSEEMCVRARDASAALEQMRNDATPF